MSFTQKLLQVNLTSGSGAFSPVQLTNLRTYCHVVSAGNFTLSECEVLVYGVPLSFMNSISTLGWKAGDPNGDTLEVFAGDSNGTSQVYKGNIWAAYSDYQGGPAIALHIVAHLGSREAGMIAKPISINNKSVDVADTMSQIAGQMGLQFESNGVSVKLAYPYLPGSLKDQAFQLAKHANVNIALDRGKLAIWPQGGSRQGTVTVTPTTGLVGYPSWSSEGIRLKMIYSPDLEIGGKIIIQGSAITPANGREWVIQRLEHSLQALTPNGEWFSNVQASTSNPANSSKSSSGT